MLAESFVHLFLFFNISSKHHNRYRCVRILVANPIPVLFGVCFWNCSIIMTFALWVIQRILSRVTSLVVCICDFAHIQFLCLRLRIFKMSPESYASKFSVYLEWSSQLRAVILVDHWPISSFLWLQTEFDWISAYNSSTYWQTWLWFFKIS